MIEFDGYLTGVAKARFFQRRRMSIAIYTTCMVLPGTLYVLSKGDWENFAIIAVGLAVIFLLIFIQGKTRAGHHLVPKKILVSGSSITCVTDMTSESRLISDVKAVRNYDEFYEFVFLFRKINVKFICQKSLLSKGTLEEFESLFHDKIVNMTK